MRTNNGSIEFVRMLAGAEFALRLASQAGDGT
jgi:hypothetical protein